MSTDSTAAAVLPELIAREPIFHHPEWGATRADFENMMAADFWEIGASGRRYDRTHILNVLEERTPHRAPCLKVMNGKQAALTAER